MPPILPWLLPRRILGLALAVTLVGTVVGIAAAVVSSDPGPFTGCLTKSGTIYSVAMPPATTPLKACGKGETQITFSNAQGPAGQNGIDGINGIDGATGPTGPQGPAGALNGAYCKAGDSSGHVTTSVDAGVGTGTGAISLVCTKTPVLSIYFPGGIGSNTTDFQGQLETSCLEPSANSSCATYAYGTLGGKGLFAYTSSPATVTCPDSSWGLVQPAAGTGGQYLCNKSTGVTSDGTMTVSFP
jgi:hypothetical protein